MNSFEYISTLLSIIIGLGITHLFVGISRMINNTKGVKIYWIHLLWSFYLFIFMISFWWFEYTYTSFSDWTFQVYLFLILYAVVLFFLSVINMPHRFPDDFKTYFFSSRKWFFAALLALNVIDVFDSMMKGTEHMTGLGTAYIIFMTFNFLMIITGLITRKEFLHGIIVILINLYQLAFLLMNLRTL